MYPKRDLTDEMFIEAAMMLRFLERDLSEAVCAVSKVIPCSQSDKFGKINDLLIEALVHVEESADKRMSAELGEKIYHISDMIKELGVTHDEFNKILAYGKAHGCHKLDRRY